MSQRSRSASLVAAALILGASVVAGAYLVSASVDRATVQMVSINKLLGGLSPGGSPAAAAAPAADKVIEVGEAPILGAADAKVTIVEWADFQCPYCGRVGPTLQQVMKEYGDDVRIAFKHLPLSFHDKALGAHQAAEAAHRQGRFWEFHDLIFANQRQLGEKIYTRYALELGLDLKQFKKDMASSSVNDRVQEDLKVAQSLGISGTPTFVINGKTLSGAQPFAAFKSVIDAELAKL
jgi:protein-disulfide isomerase